MNSKAMNKPIVKISKIADNVVLPTRGSDHAAGYDLYVNSKYSIRIAPGETANLKTGVKIEIPDGYFGGVFARSGLSTKEGLRPANCVGVIDSDYRGEIGVPIHNDSNEIRVIQPYQRVAQLVIMPYLEFDIAEVSEEELENTDRGTNGFGSTGKL